MWAVRPVQSLSACTGVHFTFTFTFRRKPRQTKKNMPDSNCFTDISLSKNNEAVTFKNTGFWKAVTLLVRVWNLVVDIAGRKEAEGVWEHGVEENIWT